MNKKTMIQKSPLFFVLMMTANIALGDYEILRVDQRVNRVNSRSPDGWENGWMWDQQIRIWAEVKNFGYDKQVGMRWSMDGWNTYRDEPAKYSYSKSGLIEEWVIDFIPFTLHSCYTCDEIEELEIEYSLYYRVGNQLFWDSNGQNNYMIKIPNFDHPLNPKSAPKTIAD